MNRVIGTRPLGLAAVCAALLLVAGCGVSGKKSAGPATTPRSGASQPSATPTSGSPAGTVPPIASWPLVRDPPSGLTFRLPKTPKVLNPAVTAPDGAAVELRIYQVELDTNLLVQVSINDLAGRSFDANGIIDGVASTTRGTVVMRSRITSGKLDIVDAKIHIPSGPSLGYDRVFKIGDHAVQMWTSGPASDEKQVRAVQSLVSKSFRAP